MSFHGARSGWRSRSCGSAGATHSAAGFADRIAVCAPIGLGLGRIANFINGELWGREAPDWLPWAMIFPAGVRSRGIPARDIRR